MHLPQSTFNAFQSYCKAVSDTFLPVEFRLLADPAQPFLSRFESSQFGALALTHAFVQSRLMGRHGRAPGAADEFVLNIVCSGLVRQSQFGRKVETPSGYMSLVASRSPFDTEQLTTTNALYIKIPGALIRSVIANPEDYCGFAIDARSGLPATFSTLVFSAWREKHQLTQADKELVSQRMIEFFRSVCSSLPGRSPARTNRPSVSVWEKAIRYINTNLGDPHLRADKVAKALNVSRSHLHAAARDHGPTIGQSILNLRLERCRQSLIDARLSERRIVDIAFDWGFNDAAHFSRAFKTRFGLSPRRYRKLRKQDLTVT